MKSLELFKVIFTAKDEEAHRLWEKKLDAHTKIARNAQTHFVEPLPQPKHYERYVAVHGAFGADMVARACVLALESVIGPADVWEKNEVIVISAEACGAVSIEDVYSYTDD
jgi:hypothetical protein